MSTWADIDGAAAHLATSVRHLRRLVYEQDGFPVHRLGGKLRFDLDELDVWLRSDGRPVLLDGACPDAVGGLRRQGALRGVAS